MSTPSHISAKLSAARRSLTVWFSAAVPALLAGAEALKDQLPAMQGLLTGWNLVAASVAVSVAVTVLRVRAVTAPVDAPASDQSSPVA